MNERIIDQSSLLEAMGTLMREAYLGPDTPGRNGTTP